MADFIYDAVPITIPSVVAGTTVGANPDGSPYFGTAYAQPTAWFKFEITEITYVRIKLSGDAGYRPYVETWHTTDGVPPVDNTNIEFYWDSWWEAGPGGVEWVQRCPFGKGTYYLAVQDWDFAGNEGAFTLDISFAPVGRNDLDFFDTDNVFDPSDSTLPPITADPGEVVYLRVAKYSFHDQPVDFSIRKTTGAPANNDLADAYQYENPSAICTPSTSLWSNAGADSQPDEPAHAGFPARKSVWFVWSPTLGVPYDIWVESTDDDYVLSVYDSFGSFEDIGPEIASDDDSGAGNQPLVTVTATGPLMIAVDSKGDGGTFALRAKLSSPSQPPNDDFGSAAILSGDAGTVSVDMTGATFECGTPIFEEALFGGGTQTVQPLGGDVWYQFVATGNDYTLTYSSPNAVRITVYTGASLSSLVPYANFAGDGRLDDFDGSGTVTFAVTPGTTYYVRVEQADDQQTNVDFTWEVPTPETGDPFEGAPEIPPPTGGGVLEWDWDLAGAGQQPGEPLEDPADKIRSVWRKFTPDHDCTYWVSNSASSYGVMPDGVDIDFWRGTTIGQLDLVPIQQALANIGGGFIAGYGVRLRKNEQYYIRISNKASDPPSSGTMKVRVENEIDFPWTDADGWDSETGTPAQWVDNVLTFSAQGYRTVNPWVDDQSGYSTWISFDVRLEANWSPTAADGPVLGRQPGPTTHYPWAGNRITILRLHVGERGTYTAGSGKVRLDIVGDRDGNSWLEMATEGGPSGDVFTRVWDHFGLPNAENEGGEWVHIDMTPTGIYVQGRATGVSQLLRIQAVDWGPVLFPTRQGWDPGDDPPETFTLQIQNMRMTDRVRDAGVVRNGKMIADFETRVMHLDTQQNVLGYSGALYPNNPSLVRRSGGSTNPVTYETPNPSANPNHQWDAVRAHNMSLYWQVYDHDSPYRHSGFWITFDAFPGPGQFVVIHARTAYENGVYLYGLCRLEVNELGEVWIDPYRLFQRPGMPGYGYGGDPYNPINTMQKIPEPRRQKIGQMALNQAYWIETWVDYTFPWDAVMRVAVNEVECFPEYRAVVNQTEESRLSWARYSGNVDAVHAYSQILMGPSAGSPQVSPSPQPQVRDETYFTGTVDAYLGPWFVGRGGMPVDPVPDVWAGEPVGKFPIGAHAGAVWPAATRTGTHRIPDAATLAKFETTPAAMAAACDGFFEYQGVRLYKGSKSLDVSINPDMSLGTTGYREKNIGAEPSLPPTVVGDGSGPVGPFGDDYSGESALEVAHDPSGPGNLDHTAYGANWPYVYVGVDAPEGVREGGDPNDDGGNHFLVFFWARRVGGTGLFINGCYDVRGDLGAGPEFSLDADESWHWLYGQSYPNYDYSGGYDAYGVWRFDFGSPSSVVHIKQVHQFMNAHTYPRFKTTVDNGASSNWMITPTDLAHPYLSDDPTDATWQSGIFMDNVCAFERWDRTGPKVPGLLGEPPTGISMGDYRHRRYIEVKPPVEADLEDTNIRPSAIKLVVRGAGFGSGEWGDVSTARTSGTLKVRMTHGNVRHVVHDFPMISTDRTLQSQCLPATPSGFEWTAFSVSELTTRMGFHFNYHDKSLDDSYGYRQYQAGSAICKALAYEVFAETVPGPPVCTLPTVWKSRLTRRI